MRRDRQTLPPPQSTRNRGESGMVLVAAMLVLAVLAILGAAGMTTSTLEVKIAGHDRDAKQAFYLAEAGLLRAQYQVVRGWGSGTGGTAGSEYTFDWTGSPTNPTWWAADKWDDFTLVDSRGVGYRILEHDPGGPYRITRCTGPNEPAAGRAHVYYRDDGVAFTGVLQLVGGNLSFPGEPWADDIWNGYVLRDDDGVLFPIANNVGDVVNVVAGTPKTGFPASILRALGSADRFTVLPSPLPGGAPGAPNAAWLGGGWSFDGWYLRDSAETLFKITGTAFPSLPDRMELTVDGTPAHGGFEIMANPWLDARAGTTVTYTSGTSGDFVVPSGITTYGSAAVTVVDESATQVGLYTLRSITAGTPLGATKEIALDVSLGEGGGVEVRNWRQIR